MWAETQGGEDYTPNCQFISDLRLCFCLEMCNRHSCHTRDKCSLPLSPVFPVFFSGPLPTPSLPLFSLAPFLSLFPINTNTISFFLHDLRYFNFIYFCGMHGKCELKGCWGEVRERDVDLLLKTKEQPWGVSPILTFKWVPWIGFRLSVFYRKCLRHWTIFLFVFLHDLKSRCY